MSRNASEASPPGGASVPAGYAAAQQGLTLIEITVALAVSGILVGGLAHFFKSFSRTFNVQEQITDRDLNAHYTVKRLSEVFMAAGANLPSKGWEIVGLPGGNPSDRVRLSVNPRGGIQYVANPLGGMELPVDDAKGFAKASAVLVAPKDQDDPLYKVSIDVGYNANGFSNGVKAAGSGAILRMASALNLQAGDVAYAYAEEEYRLVGTNLMLGDMVLAENIETLAITFLTSGQSATSQWSAMRSARVKIRARTRLPDPGIAEDGGYRKIELSTDVLLRNRI